MIYQHFFKEITTLKAHFIRHKELIIELLKSSKSIKKQALEFSDAINQKCSASTYMKYSKEFYLEFYLEHLNIIVVKMNKFIIYSLYMEGERDLGKIYLSLMQKGTLTKAKNNEKDIISYNDFKRLLQFDFQEAGIKDVIYPDSVSDDNQHQNNLIFPKNPTESKPLREEKPFVIANEKKEEKSSVAQKSKNQKIDIELLDGTFESCPIMYLKSEIIMKEHSNNIYDFNEKNYIVVPSLYKKREVIFDIVKKYLLEHRMMRNYSLIFHNNGRTDGFMYIYRLIDDDFLLLKKIRAGFSMDFEIYNNNGVTNFFELFNDLLNECLGDTI